ncbi:PilZ domain-containing protein [Pelobacter seleniigenes]|uniref:PilZ domain-containing protein n=1 Tax=Pelobacter seleniigenes TaxID=407188 RepID=UPI0004A73EB9|nr:PilZ domain-containing protein [Pelobacter seleniigenes]
MLIMKCPECQKYISSALLAEIPRIVCEHCGSEVAVKNILVSSNGFTFDRDDLLKRFFRYRKLLDEVIDERNTLAESAAVSAESKRSMQQFLTILQGMMTGARDNFRCLFADPIKVHLAYEQHRASCIFYNLSMTGACVLLPPSQPLPRVKGQMQLKFQLPGQERSYELGGRVCWTETAKEKAADGHRVGINFAPLDQVTRNDLWLYISQVATKVSV